MSTTKRESVPPAAGARPSPRPRFSLESAFSPTDICGRVNKLIKASPGLRGIAFEHRIELAISGDEHHFWSPQLVVEVHPIEGGTRLDARFGPDPYVWALYWMSYLALFVVACISGIFGLVQVSIGQSPWALYITPGAVVLGGLVYGASFVGQGLGSEQMYSLRATLTDIVEGQPVA
ncbi:MAG: hypothetical protein U0271_00260 [Polyangiaceae bacterium]